jgi:hypothetical protein
MVQFYDASLKIFLFIASQYYTVFRRTIYFTRLSMYFELIVRKTPI